jgi:hypothetical protein
VEGGRGGKDGKFMEALLEIQSEDLDTSCRTRAADVRRGRGTGGRG